MECRRGARSDCLFRTADHRNCPSGNSFYQDGATEGAASRIKRVAAAIAAIELVPLVGLAIWALSLRVGQYGWSVERIFAAAAIAVAACYTLGYAVAVVLSPTTLKRIEITNFVTACVFLALALALFTPLGDPARLMVADQVARLKSGAIAAEKFDFEALKFDGAGWGHDAPVELSQAKDGADAAAIRDLASRAIVATYRYKPAPSAVYVPNKLPTVEEMEARIVIHPSGRALPPGLLDLNGGPFTSATLPSCLRYTKGPECVVHFIVLHPGDAEAILFVDGVGGRLLEADAASGRWRESGHLSGAVLCASVREALQRGEFSVEPNPLPDLVVGNLRLNFDPPLMRCPN
ncbi:MAG TPA: DUF4153 domain-containing protein [Xanthobacteraceae bacterium]|nr:DUF4153 domain-containing protein [Xanthobacteraceae bacterium]